VNKCTENLLKSSFKNSFKKNENSVNLQKNQFLNEKDLMCPIPLENKLEILEKSYRKINETNEDIEKTNINIFSLYTIDSLDNKFTRKEANENKNTKNKFMENEIKLKKADEGKIKFISNLTKLNISGKSKNMKVIDIISINKVIEEKKKNKNSQINLTNSNKLSKKASFIPNKSTGYNINILNNNNKNSPQIKKGSARIKSSQKIVKDIPQIIEKNIIKLKSNTSNIPKNIVDKNPIKHKKLIPKISLIKRDNLKNCDSPNKYIKLYKKSESAIITLNETKKIITSLNKNKITKKTHENYEALLEKNKEEIKNQNETREEIVNRGNSNDSCLSSIEFDIINLESNNDKKKDIDNQLQIDVKDEINSNNISILNKNESVELNINNHFIDTNENDRKTKKRIYNILSENLFSMNENKQVKINEENTFDRNIRDDEFDKIKILEEKRKKIYSKLGYDLIEPEKKMITFNNLSIKSSDVEVLKNVNIKRLANILQRRLLGLGPEKEEIEVKKNDDKNQYCGLKAINEDDDEFIKFNINNKKKTFNKRFSFQ